MEANFYQNYAKSASHDTLKQNMYILYFVFFS